MAKIIGGTSGQRPHQGYTEIEVDLQPEDVEQVRKDEIAKALERVRELRIPQPQKGTGIEVKG